MEYDIQTALNVNETLKKLLALEDERPFKLSGKTRLALLKNVRIATNVATDFDAARNALIKANGKPNDTGGVTIAPNTPEHAAFVSAIADLLREPADLRGCAFSVIPFGDLADDNATPIGILSDLVTLGLIALPEDKPAPVNKEVTA